MAAVTPQITRLHNVEGTLTLTSIGGGQGTGENAEIVIQGSQSAGRKQSNTTDHGFFLQVPSTTVTGNHIGVWINHIHYSVLTKLALRFGSTTNAWHEHAFNLANYPAVGGWIKVWVNVDRTPEATAGSFNKSGLTQVGILASLPAVSGNAPNLVMDASDLTSTGLLLTGTGGVFQDFVDADEGNSTNKYGIVSTNSEVIFCLGRLTFGSGTSLVFDDSNVVVVFPSQPLVASNFMGATLDLSNASTDITWNSSVVRSSGTVKGDLIVSGTAGVFKANGCSFGSLRVITLTSTCTLDTCSIGSSGQITANGATIKSSVISGSTATSALLWDTVDDTSGKLDNTDFSSGGSGHGIELGSNTLSSITLNQVNFSGYGLDDTTDAALYNNSGKEITINVVGGSAPSVRNGSGASTILVVDPRSFLFSVSDQAGNPVTGYEWRLYEDDPDPGVLGSTELDGEESATQSSQEYSYTYSQDQGVVLQVIHNNFEESITRTTLTNANQNINVVLEPEENV